MGTQLQEFEKLFHQYRPGLLSFAHSIINSRTDSDEIVNDVFLAIWDKRNELELGLGIKSYLFTAVKNRCLNHLKKNKLPFAEMSDEMPVAANSPGVLEQIMAREAEKRIQFLIDQLPKKCKQVFLLSRMQELSYKEIAEIMDISPKTVENQIGLALKFLKEGMQLAQNKSM